MTSRFVRVHNQSLSLWQSAVAETVRKQQDNLLVTNQVLDHPFVQATNTYVHLASTQPHFDAAHFATTQQPLNSVYLSQLGHQIGMAQVEGDAFRAESLLTTYRHYSDKDLNFITACTAAYAYYASYTDGTMVYNDWTVAGNNDLTYGVIDYKLPNDAVIGIIGDWGTGLDDAQALLLDLMQQHKPAALIHLGDIYYSGTPGECQATFATIIQNVFDQVLGKGNRIPVFTLAGNHDYYAWGVGFYPMLTQLNQSIAGAQQVASYFCLRTQDDGWQFLGMDTGLNDSNPLDQVDAFYAGPWLQPTEITWHRDKLTNFNGATVLLSHHQLFSANATLNGKFSPYRDLAYFNPFLYEAFYDFLPTKVAGWLWGHEHNLALYQNNLFGLSKGRLIGCSAYEELTSSNPYTINNAQVPYLAPPPQYQLHTNTDPNNVTYYNHAYAIVDLSGRSQPTDPVTIRYYEFPSWGSIPPPLPASQLIFSEPLALPAISPQPAVQSGVSIYLLGQEGLFFSSLYSGREYYPTLDTGGPVALILIRPAGQGPLTDGDTVLIQTTESAAGSYNQLGAWITPRLYYYSQGYGQQQWTIRKRDLSGDSTIHYSDEIYLINQYYSDQVLCSSFSAMYGDIYLTTQAGITYYWSIQPGIAVTLPQSPSTASSFLPVAPAGRARRSGLIDSSQINQITQ